ncbi:multidrug efflux pump subunit AcrA (membrane-fusion protein) [Diaminobutyricimonas aerilata]|uniref:Multidrug efflux pump subunit AcrA (Membrane-fusion protein) n=1 Tax=Diaminobutyricimonas aerilata TaxID=1162967 RepID=A0A2M9CG08_9MICO|nr:peptidoglycan-binding protein [Diaminobutyricimonas aerilata]PJJ70817.1 multidrug efflux pump subunit AcrA (membrane-fusion protein) [Diaminobutyricimonas aerilata]
MTIAWRRRATLGAIAAIGAGAVLVAANGGFAVGVGAAPSAEDDLPAATAEVTRQTLVDAQRVDGELGYGSPFTLSAAAAGTVTEVPATGTVVERGQALYRIDDDPIVLLYGTLPAYRPLARGDEGADVQQLEQNLAALGYTGFDVDTEYTRATATAVEQWQEDLGREQTGIVDPAAVRFADGAVRVGAREAGVGDRVQPGATVYTATGLTRTVTVELDVDDERLAVAGNAVTVTLPDGTTFEGSIASVSSEIEAGEGPEAEPTTVLVVEVVPVEGADLGALDTASVEVDFTAETREGVLAVPVAALLALAEGGYALEVVTDGGTQLVAVTTGLFADGLVEVSGEGVTEGTVVGVPS